MKKPVCFPIAFLVSVLMFVAAGLFIKLNAGLMQQAISTGFFMMAVNAVCALKFALLIIILMPRKPVLTQLALGFVLADMLIMFLCIMINTGLTTPVPLFIVQALFIVYYMIVQGRLWIYKSDNTSLKIKNDLVTPTFKSRLI